MAHLSIHLFGRFCAKRGEARLEGLGSSKLQELLCYLLLNRNRAHSRESLAALFWGDTTTAQSKKYLRQSLWQLQSALGGKVGPDSTPTLVVEPDWVHVNSDCDMWVDVAAFELAFVHSEEVPGQRLEGAEAVQLKDAVALYVGDLMEGCYQHWCLYERERFQNIYLAMLDKLMSFCETHRHYETAFRYGARILSHDRAREHTHVKLMRLRYLAGDRTGALRQYASCVKALEEELGVRPAEKTTRLYEQICRDRLNLPVIASEGMSLPAVEGIEPQRHLELVRAALLRLQNQIRQELTAVECELSDERR